MNRSAKVQATLLTCAAAIPFAFLIALILYESHAGKIDRDNKANDAATARGLIVKRRDADIADLKSTLETDIRSHSADRYTATDAARDRAEFDRRLRAVELTARPTMEP